MSAVYFMRFDGKKWNIIRAIDRLLNVAKVADIIDEGDIVAIKTHMGERGNFRHPRPQIIRTVVEFVKRHGGKPFVTDTTTLYSGYRRDACEYLETAAMNGFSIGTVGAPIIIADGLRGRDYVEVKTGGDLRSVAVATAIAEADSMIVVSHVKFHITFGFGGALKNLAMGCVARKTKFAMHAVSKPTINKEKCTGCGQCVRHCNWGAISLVNGKAEIDYERCVGCGDCVAICRFGAARISWSEGENLLRLAAESAHGVVKTFEKGKIFYINLLMEVTGYCDCGTPLEAPIVPDIGILASYDPVAIDQASMDLVNQAPGYLCHGSGFKLIEPGVDKSRALRPGIRWEVLLEAAEQWKLGSRKYKLIAL